MSNTTQSLIENFLSLASDLAKTGKIPPLAWVGSHENASYITLPLEIRDGEIDTDAANDVKEAAWDLSADFVVWVAESYILHDREAIEDYLANKNKYKTVADHPGRKEVLLVNCETPMAKFYGIVPLTRNKTQLTLGKIEYLPASSHEDMRPRFLRPAN